jgi:hypothetical protein
LLIRRDPAASTSSNRRFRLDTLQPHKFRTGCGLVSGAAASVAATVGWFIESAPGQDPLSRQQSVTLLTGAEQMEIQQSSPEETCRTRSTALEVLWGAYTSGSNGEDLAAAIEDDDEDDDDEDDDDDDEDEEDDDDDQDDGNSDEGDGYSE